MPNYGPRLPVSTVQAAIDWTPPDAFWCSILSHFGGHLSTEQRAEVVRVVRAYISAAEHEQAAGKVEDARDRLAELRAVGDPFWQTLQRGRASQPVNSLLEDHLDPRADGSGVTITQLVLIMTEFMIACDRAEKTLESYRGERFFGHGEAWTEVLVRQLAQFYEQTGRRPTASDSARLPSPFTRLVSDLQQQLPERFREYTFSEGGLSGALKRALTAWRRAKQHGVP